MAPELLSGSAYGMPADVYSFGVLLWELVTQKTPYGDFTTQFAIIKFVSDGNRLEIPESPISGLTAKCWSQDATIRPTFAQIVSEL